MKPGAAEGSLVLETNIEIETAYDTVRAIELDLVENLSRVDINVARNLLEDSFLYAPLTLTVNNSRTVFIALEQATSNPDFPSQSIRFTAGDMLNDYYRKKKLNSSS